MRRRPPFRVRVPGSTSNLGPGFDLLGLALDLHLTVEVRGVGRERLARRGTLAGLDLPPGDDLVLRAAHALARLEGAVLPPLDLVVSSQIPVARGLGSSGAATAAGLVLADALLGAGRSRDALAAIGSDLEGHPENAAASLLGGLVAGAPAEGGNGWLFRPLPLHPRLRVAVAWPEVRIATEEARAALPREVPFAVARDNARNVALLIDGLRTLDPRTLAAGIRDGLHLPFRAPRVPGYEAVVGAARRAGALAATISGSGSAVIALCGDPKTAQAAARGMAAAFRAAGSGGTGRAVRVAAAPARVG